MTDERMERFIAAAERLRLDDYVRFESDRRRRLTDAFWQGVARGLGIMVGFAVLGAVVVMILRRVAMQNVPFFSDFVAQIVRLTEMKLN